jgi:hypothetical protein
MTAREVSPPGARIGDDQPSFWRNGTTRDAKSSGSDIGDMLLTVENEDAGIRERGRNDFNVRSARIGTVLAGDQEHRHRNGLDKLGRVLQ